MLKKNYLGFLGRREGWCYKQTRVCFSTIFSFRAHFYFPIHCSYKVRNSHPLQKCITFPPPARFSSSLSRRSKSPRRLEKADRLERLDRPVKPVREPSHRGREREPAERQRGRFLEESGQPVRERHHRYERERPLRGEGRKERELQSQKVGSYRDTGCILLGH